MKAHLLIVIMETLLFTAGGVAAVVPADADAISAVQAIGCSVIGCGCGGLLGIGVSYRSVRDGKLSVAEVALRSLLNIAGGFPGGLIAGYLLPQWGPLSGVPQWACFVTGGALSGLLSVALASVALKFIRGLPGKEILSWLAKIPLNNKKP